MRQQLHSCHGTSLHCCTVSSIRYILILRRASLAPPRRRAPRGLRSRRAMPPHADWPLGPRTHRRRHPTARSALRAPQPASPRAPLPPATGPKRRPHGPRRALRCRPDRPACRSHPPRLPQTLRRLPTPRHPSGIVRITPITCCTASRPKRNHFCSPRVMLFCAS